MAKKWILNFGLLIYSGLVLNVISCAEEPDVVGDQFEIVDLDLTSDVGLVIKNQLEQEDTWEVVNGISYAGLGNYKKGHFNLGIEGLNNLNQQQMLIYRENFDVTRTLWKHHYSEVYLNWNLVFDDATFVNDLTFSTWPAFIEYLPIFYLNVLKDDNSKATIEYVEANQEPSAKLVGNNWTKQNYDQTKIIFPANSSLLNELLNVNHQQGALLTIEANLKIIEDELRKYFLNANLPNWEQFNTLENILNQEDKSQLNFDVFASEDNSLPDHIELHINNLDLAEIREKLFCNFYAQKNQVLDNLSDREQILTQLINSAIEDNNS